VEKFRTIGYFYENYVNQIDGELEEGIEFFFLYEDKEIIKAFQEEIEILYTMLIKKSDDVSGRKISTKRSVNREMYEIKLLYERGAEKRKFRMIWYFMNQYLCRIDYFDLKACIEDFFMRENIETLEKEIETRYIVNDPELMKETTYLEGKVEKFLEWENEERIKAFQKEIETVYICINNPALMKKAAYRLGGDIRMLVKKAVCVIKLLYDHGVKKGSLQFHPGPYRIKPTLIYHLQADQGENENG